MEKFIGLCALHNAKTKYLFIKVESGRRISEMFTFLSV